MLLIFTCLVILGLAGLAYVTSRRGYQLLAAFLAAAAWLFLGLNYWLFQWS